MLPVQQRGLASGWSWRSACGFDAQKLREAREGALRKHFQIILICWEFDREYVLHTACWVLNQEEKLSKNQQKIFFWARCLQLIGLLGPEINQKVSCRRYGRVERVGQHRWPKQPISYTLFYMSTECISTKHWRQAIACSPLIVYRPGKYSSRCTHNASLHCCSSLIATRMTVNTEQSVRTTLLIRHAACLSFVYTPSIDVPNEV
jgi:hypothetical protein